LLRSRGIAEALVATAVGLLAAIPAMMAYNAFGGRIDGILAMLDRFSTQFEEDLNQLVQTQAIHTISGSDVERVPRVEEG
jgi:biopolymer transport protein TolQ